MFTSISVKMRSIATFCHQTPALARSASPLLLSLGVIRSISDEARGAIERSMKNFNLSPKKAEEEQLEKQRAAMLKKDLELIMAVNSKYSVDCVAELTNVIKGKSPEELSALIEKSKQNEAILKDWVEKGGDPASKKVQDMIRSQFDLMPSSFQQLAKSHDQFYLDLVRPAIEKGSSTYSQCLALGKDGPERMWKAYQHFVSSHLKHGSKDQS